MKARFFDGVIKSYCAQMSEAWKKKSLCINKTEIGQREQSREDEEQTTSLTTARTFGFTNSLSVRLAAVKERGVKNDSVGGRRTPT